MSLRPAARAAWKAIPAPGALKRLAGPALYDASLTLARLVRRAPPVASLQPGPLVVSGFYNDVLGIGRGVGLTADALERAGLPVVRHDIRPVIASPPFARAVLPAGPGGVWILHCNAPETDLLFSHLGHADIARRYRVAYWAWELAKAPRAWRTAARAFHEIWVPSRFVAAALGDVGRPVHIMPHPLQPPKPQPPDRARFGIPPGAVAFGVFADARSSLARKNPLGAIRAYLAAFPKETGASFLSVKLVAPEADPQGAAELEAAAAGRGDIRIWADRLSDTDMAVLHSSLDAVISLHRGEGFGLVVAEAYLAGKPAIATAWSGNLDFVEPELEPLLVPSRLIPVRDPAGRYHGGAWADPDLACAAEKMRSLAMAPQRLIIDPIVVERIAMRLHEPWRSSELSRQPWAQLVTPGVG